MSIVHELLSCFCGNDYDDLITSASENNTNKRKAQEIVDRLYTSEKAGLELQHELKSIVKTNNWNEKLAEAILNALDGAVRAGRAMSGPMEEAYNKALEIAESVEGFVKEHPVFCTVVVFGIMVLLMPWALEALGFAAEGPVADSFAALWQSRYANSVPKGSLFSFFQRLGMTWRA